MPPHSRGGQPDIEHPGAGTLFVHGQSYASSSKRSSLIGARSRSRTPVRLRPSSNSRSRERNAERFAKYPPDWQDVTVVCLHLETTTYIWADQTGEGGSHYSCADSSGCPAFQRRGRLHIHLCAGGSVGTRQILDCVQSSRARCEACESVATSHITILTVQYALKHTPLYPHHPLIAARLLREPTLLAQLPAHPCLVGVEGWIRTEGHFYLIGTLRLLLTVTFSRITISS